MKRIISVILVIAMCLGLAGVAAAETSVSDKVFTVLHTNDVHGNVEIEPYVKGYADSLREGGRDVAVVSAGDAFAGADFATYDAGKSVAEVMNLAGYDMMVIGNHEMMMNTADFAAAAEVAEFTLLGCNVADSYKEAVPAIQGYEIKELADTKVAFIGIAAILGTSGDDTVAATQAAIAAAKKDGASIIIGISHLGTTDPDETIRTTYVLDKISDFDAVIDGHCHTPYENGRDYNGVLIGETGEYGNNIGVMNFYLKNGKLVDVDASLIKVKGNESDCGITPDADVQACIDGVKKELEYLNEVVVTLPVDLLGEREFVRSRETNFGNLVADAMLWKSGADISFFSGPYIRSSLPAGDVTRSQLNAALYMDVDLCVTSFTGAEILGFIETGLASYPELNNQFMHMGGIRVEFDISKAEGRVVSAVLKDGKKLDPEQTYKCVVRGDLLNYYVTYVLEKAEPVEGKDYTKDIGTIVNAFIEYVKSGANIPADIDGRMQPTLRFSDVSNSHWAYASIYNAAAQQLVNGYSDNTFKPGNTITRAEAVAILFRLYGSEADLAVLDEFSDISSSHWAAKEMAWAVENGIIEGYSDGRVSPNGELTRAALATILYRMKDEFELDGESTVEVKLTDISGHWAEAAMKYLAENGVITGYEDNTFRPNKSISRAETVTMLLRVI